VGDLEQLDRFRIIQMVKNTESEHDVKVIAFRQRVPTHALTHEKKPGKPLLRQLDVLRAGIESHVICRRQIRDYRARPAADL
jgi:hypothetical protein